MKRLGTMTLGCKVNHTETQAIEGLFKTKGYQIVPFEERAEFFLINTCSVTHLGERKSRQIIKNGTVVDGEFEFAEECHVHKDSEG